MESLRIIEKELTKSRKYVLDADKRTSKLERQVQRLSMENERLKDINKRQRIAFLMQIDILETNLKGYSKLRKEYSNLQRTYSNLQANYYSLHTSTRQMMLRLQNSHKSH